MKFLPVLIYVLAALAVLFLAGAGASGSVRGAVRYMRTWFGVVMVMVLAALLLSIALA